jgi:preprotein translocase subunit SecD
MVTYYKLSGVNAVVALMFNLIILLGLMAYIGAVMTLPGIAGFVLTMGIGVDSNVLIFERIKEELDAQRGVRAAINAGFSRVFLTLMDTHISALIAALFLIQFGTGPIRGFAYTLMIGLASNLFTSTFVSKTLFEIALGRRQQQHAATLSI